jgi:cytosine/adenosine deaminase-related metal-dependent hydrolase
MTSSWTITARWVLSMEGPPLERGTVTIRGEHLLAVEPHGSLTPDVDVGNAALLPGLVNAHTHLDLSGLRGQTPPGPDFTGWLRAVVNHRRNLTSEQVQRAVQTGVAEAISSGTTLIGDISAQGLSWPILAEAPLRAVVFHELLGLPRLRARTAWAEAKTWLAGHPATPTCRPGLSPHAPYSVRASLFRAAAALARKHGYPLAIHLAETRGELDLLDQGSGEFPVFLAELGAWDPEGVVGGIDEVLEAAREVSRVLFVHANYLKESGSLPSGGTIVFCPRTHAAFGHPRHPWVASRNEAGEGLVPIALGTDSLASNPDLDVLHEARFLHQQYPEIPPGRIVGMITLAGARALGWPEQTGSLCRGKSADLVVVPLTQGQDSDPFRLVLESSFRVAKVLFQGKWVSPAKDQAGSNLEIHPVKSYQST